MFRPRTSQISHEEFLDADEDVSCSVPEAQAVRAGLLRLLPLTGALEASELSWTRLEWGQDEELIMLPGDIGERWDTDFNNVPISDPQLLEFDANTNFLDIDTEVDEYQFISQKPANPVGKKYWVDQVDNALGWVVQVRVQSVVDPTGYSTDGHYIELDDGVHRERIYIHQTGLTFEQNPALNIRCDLTRPREIRIGAKQDDLYVLLDDGQGVAGLDGFLGASNEKILGFGTTGGVPERFETIWDYVRQYHGGAWLDDRDLVEAAYSTTGSTGTTQSYAPKRRVRRFDAAYVHTVGDLLNGTTTVVVQHKSGEDDWATYSTTEISTLGTQKIDLSQLDVAGDGTDELRFLVTQVSDTGAGEPPRVDQITVLTTFAFPGVKVSPPWANRVGGSMHVVDLLTGAEQGFQVPSLTTGLSFLARFDDSYLEEISQDEGVDTNAEFVDGKFGKAAKLGGLTSAASDWTDLAEEFTERVPFGYLTAIADPVYAGVGSLILGTRSISVLIGTTPTNFEGQACVASEEGDGWKVPAITCPGAFGFLLKIEAGSVKVKHGSKEHVFTVYDYWNPATVIFLSSGSVDLEFTAAEPNSEWAVARATAYTATIGDVVFAGAAHATDQGFAADIFVTPHAFDEGPLFGRLDTLDGWEIGLAPGGYPYVRAGDGATLDMVTGNYPLMLGRRYNLGLNYRRFSDHTGLQVLVDGDVAGEKITVLDDVTEGLADVTVGNTQPGIYEQARVHADQIDAHLFSVVNGFSNPTFQSAYSVPRSANNLFIMRFGNRGGAHTDDAGRAHHAYSTLAGRSGLARDRLFESRSAYLFWHGGELGILHTPDFVQALPQALFVRGLFLTTTRIQEIYSKWNAGETIGWKVEVLTDGSVKVTVKDGSTHELTSDVVLADQQRRSLYVEVTTTGITIRIDQEESTLSEAIGSLAAANQDALIGHHLVAYIGELVVRNATLSEDTYEEWRDVSFAKWTPDDDQIVIDGEAIPNDQIIHFGPTRKFFAASPNTPGYKTLWVAADGVEISADRPFRYTHGYDRTIPADRIDSQVQRTKSVFRILNRVPDGSVNLAFIQGPDISVEANLSSIDLSFSRGENLSTYFGGEFAVKRPEVGDGFALYTGQLDTDDVRITNRSVMRRGVKQPTPLFYRYLIGRGRRYIYQPNALSVSDIEVIRNGIHILDGYGQSIPFERYPWEIEVSAKDVHGRDLPPNVFAVTLFTNLAFIEELSIQVRYAAADALNEYQIQNNFLEIVNPEAAMARVVSDPGYDEYVVELEPTGTYELSVGQTGS